MCLYERVAIHLNSCVWDFKGSLWLCGGTKQHVGLGSTIICSLYSAVVYVRMSSLVAPQQICLLAQERIPAALNVLSHAFFRETLYSHLYPRECERLEHLQISFAEYLREVPRSYILCILLLIVASYIALVTP